MASSSKSTTEEPMIERRQRRASKPKVKTGCNNCKSRRVKCDETRPQCAKCVKSGRKCDGYPAFNPRRDGSLSTYITPIAPAPPAVRPRPIPITNGFAKSSTSPSASSSASSSYSSSSSSYSRSPPTPRAASSFVKKPRQKSLSPPPKSPAPIITYSPRNSAPSISLAFDQQESLYFTLFREHTANELSGFFSSRFWTRSVLQESHSEASIKHAVVALGALYKTLEKASESPPSSPDDTYYVDTAPDHFEFARQQYGKSIARLREALQNNEPGSSRTALISVVLFTCIQSFIGDHKAAIQQIQAGLRMLDERRAEKRQPLERQRVDDLEDELVQMFTRLAIQAKSYDMAFHFPHPYVIRLTPSTSPASPAEPGSPSAASTTSVETVMPAVFESLQDARVALDSLCERMIRYSEALQSYYGGPSNIHPASIRSSGSAFRIAMDNWSRAFDPILERRRTNGVTNTQRAGTNVLKMMQLMCAALFWSGFSLSEQIFDNFLADFKSIVELAREIVVDEELSLAAKKCGNAMNCHHRERGMQTNGLHHHPYEEDHYSHIKASFALDLGIVPPLFVVATKCRDRKVRREAIRLLMSSPRREGMWDSILSGRAAQWIMEIEEERLPPFNPWSSPGADPDWADAIPAEDQRVMVQEILFDLEKRHATIRCGTRGLHDGNQPDARSRETSITW